MRRLMMTVVAMLMIAAGTVLTTAPAQAVSDYWSGYKRCVVAGHSDYAVGAWWKRTTDGRTMIHGSAWKPYGDPGILPNKVDRMHMYQYYNGTRVNIVDVNVTEGWSGSGTFTISTSSLRPISGNNTVQMVPVGHNGAGICSVTVPGP